MTLGCLNRLRLVRCCIGVVYHSAGTQRAFGGSPDAMRLMQDEELRSPRSVSPVA